MVCTKIITFNYFCDIRLSFFYQNLCLMRKYLLFFAALFLFFNIASAQDGRYELINNMPVYHDSIKSQLTYPLSWSNYKSKNFQKWKKEGRAKLYECALRAPLKCDFDAKTVAVEKKGNYETTKIELNISSFSRVPGYLLIPDGDGHFPAILLLHDHGAMFDIGKEKMVRPIGSDFVAQSEQWIEKCYDSQYVGDYFASHGFVVFVIDALFWGERSNKGGSLYDGQQALASNLFQLGMCWGGMMLYDDIRSAEFLASLPFVDKHRIGALGFSMGGYRSWMVAAATDVITCGASICWMNTTDYLMTLTNNQNKGGSAYSMLLPGIRNYMDYPDVASLACPKPMLFICGTKDKLFPIEGVEMAFDKMRKVWEDRGASELLITDTVDGPHSFSKEMQKKTLDFFINL